MTSEVPRQTAIRESFRYGQRIKFEQEHGKAIFVCEFNPTFEEFDFYWSSDIDYKDFRQTVSDEEREIRWEDNCVGDFGITPEYEYWFDPTFKKDGQAMEAGAHIKAAILKNEKNGVLKKIIKIARRTVNVKTQLPENFSDTLCKFIMASSDKPRSK